MQTTVGRQAADEPTPTLAFVTPSSSGDKTPHSVPAFDFSRGSDQRLIKTIEKAQESSYHAVVDGYLQACAARPDDAVLAIERVHFVERFANGEDVMIESAGSDLAAAVDYVQNHFPEAPGTVLYNLSNIYDDTFDAKANAAARLISHWGNEDQARFLLLRAQYCERMRTPVRTHLFAEQSFSAYPTPEAGLLLAKALHDNKDDATCQRTLMHAVFDTATPWIKRQKMDLLLDLGLRESARALFEELRTANRWLVTNEETANRLARNGEVALARAILGEMPQNDFNRESLLRARFRFELEHGNTLQAENAYRALRELGLGTDPFLRDRFTLLRRCPGASWNLQDVAGALTLSALGVAAFAFPLLLLVPIHYWSLLRVRKDKLPGWPDAFWGLRAIWIVLGTLCSAELALLWFYEPASLHAFSNAASATTQTAEASFPAAIGSILASSLLVLAILFHKRAWPLLGTGIWGIGRSIGLGVSIAVALRIVLRVYVLFVPSAIAQQSAAAVPTVQIMLGLREHLGPLGLFGITAILVPIIEEMLFRGLLLQGLARHIPFVWANLIQAFLFAIAHQNLPLLPFYLGMAILAGYFARRSGGLLASIIMHATNNAAVCVAVLLLK